MACCGNAAIPAAAPLFPAAPALSNGCHRTSWVCQCIANISTWVQTLNDCTLNTNCTGQLSCTPTDAVIELLNGCVFASPAPAAIAPWCLPSCCPAPIPAVLPVTVPVGPPPTYPPPVTPPVTPPPTYPVLTPPVTSPPTTPPTYPVYTTPPLTTPPPSQCKFTYVASCTGGVWHLVASIANGCTPGCVSDFGWQGDGCERTYKFCGDPC